MQIRDVIWHHINYCYPSKNPLRHVMMFIWWIQRLHQGITGSNLAQIDNRFMFIVTWKHKTVCGLWCIVIHSPITRTFTPWLMLSPPVLPGLQAKQTCRFRQTPQLLVWVLLIIPCGEYIGSSFMITSNINDWSSAIQALGSLGDNQWMDQLLVQILWMSQQTVQVHQVKLFGHHVVLGIS